MKAFTYAARFFFFALGALVHADSRRLRETTRQGRQKVEEGPLLCRITIVGIMSEMEGGGEEDIQQTQETACIPIYDDEESSTMLTVTLPQEIADAYAQEVNYGRLIVSIDGALIEGEEIVMTEHANVTVVENHADTRRLAPNQPATGIRSLMIVRVSTTDASPDYTLAEMRARIFDDNGVSVKTQYSACSYGQLQFLDAGGMNVKVDQPIADFWGPGGLVSATTAKIESNPSLGKVADLADHIMFCMPYGTGGWIAVAPVNHWRTVYNNQWCLSMGAVMHELGHNLGLLHSGDDTSKYGDKSGYMGSGSLQQDGPRKCFNGLKSWQLGWYSTRNLKVDPFIPSKIKLATFVDFAMTKPTEAVVLNIGDEYYFQYNRRKGMNIETGRAPNLVTVTQDAEGRSLNLAGLGVGGRWTRENYKESGKNLIVEVCTEVAGSSSTPDAMILSIALGQSYCNRDLPGPTSAPTPAPSPAPTAAPIIAPTIVLQPTPTSTVTTPIHLNAGGPPFYFRGTRYESDTPYASGGKTFSTNAPIEGTAKDLLYQSERYGNVTYTFDDLPSGNYSVHLYFAEIYYGITSSGQRIFNVYVQDQLFLGNLDVWMQSGGLYQAYRRRTEARVSSDGRLVIAIRNGPAQKAKIAGIDIMPL